MKCILVKKKRQVNTYALLRRTALCFLDKGKAQPDGAFHQFLGSQAFTAFTFEAYLNHIGPRVFKSWNDRKRLGVICKLNVVCERVGLNPDYGKRPWQTIRHLVEFRNVIAPGESCSLEPEFRIKTHSGRRS